MSDAEGAINQGVADYAYEYGGTVFNSSVFQPCQLPRILAI